VTRLAAGRPGTPWSPSCRWARRGRSCCARAVARLAGAGDRGWRPAGPGRQLPARLGARRAQDGPGRRAADQRAVPSRRGPLIQDARAMQPSAGRRWSGWL
jgi:hypothetical protein